MSSEDHWEVLPLDRPFSDKNWPKKQRKWPYYETVFCFCHNFLYDACFSIPFSLVTYICSILRSGTHIDHHFGHILAIFCGAIMVNFSKLTIMAQKNDYDMAIGVVYMVASIKKGENVDHLWKRIWKICIVSKVMAKTKYGHKLWPFPLYFCYIFVRKWPFQGKHFPMVLRAHLYIFGISGSRRTGITCKLIPNPTFWFFAPP